MGKQISLISSILLQKDTRVLCAMKTLIKKDVIVNRQAAHVKAERDILAMTGFRRQCYLELLVP